MKGKIKMSVIDVTNDGFTCQQEDDLAVLTILEGAKVLSTTVSGKENLMELLKTIRESRQIKGIAVLYSHNYPGDAEYRKFLQESLEEKHTRDKSRYAITYKIALFHFTTIYFFITIGLW